MPLPQKILRNKAVVALSLCGFSQGEIGELLGSDRRNIQFFVKKYTPRYLEHILDMLIKHLAETMLCPKRIPTKKGGK